MRVRTERDSSEKRRNDRPPRKLGDDAQLAHFEPEPRRHRNDLPDVTEEAAKVRSKLTVLRVRVWVKQWTLVGI
jgi:hypothetical protein